MRPPSSLSKAQRGWGGGRRLAPGLYQYSRRFASPGTFIPGPALPAAQGYEVAGCVKKTVSVSLRLAPSEVDACLAGLCLSVPSTISPPPPDWSPRLRACAWASNQSDLPVPRRPGGTRYPAPKLIHEYVNALEGGRNRRRAGPCAPSRCGRCSGATAIRPPPAGPGSQRLIDFVADPGGQVPY